MKNRIFQILCKNRFLINVSFIIFISGLTAGIISYDQVKEGIPSLMETVYSGIISESVYATIINVIIRNLWASSIITVLGITVFLSGILLFFNGFILGVVIRLAYSNGLNLLNIILGIIPHGLFEIPALLISASVGMRMGLELIRSPPKERIKNICTSIKEASQVYLTIVIPLLILAAFVEIMISRNLILLKITL